VSISVVLPKAAAQLLGQPCKVTAVLAGAVARIATTSGEEFVVKQHLNRPLHEREVHAYRCWTRALGASTPRLVAVDDPAMIIVTSALPGGPGSGDLTPFVHRQAGALLRRFHDAEPPCALTWFRDWLRKRAGHWTSRAAMLLSAADARIIDSHLAALSRMGVPTGGPCHLDFQPRNWLIGRSGDVSLIDFEHARIDLPARDLVRLRFRIWAGRPDLRDAFLDGYGRPLTHAEDQLIWHLGALDALTALARGHENADPELTAAGRTTLRMLREQP
jgi:Phosphotransferase enzyme family